MKLLTLDFETAYGKHPVTKENITLSAMTTEEYLRHPLFKVHCVGLKYDNEEAFYVVDEEIKAVFETINWENIAVLCHHAHFDGAILNWVYGIRPLFWIDTLSMANALFPWMSSSLSKLAEHFNAGAKGGALVKTKDLWELHPRTMRSLGEYCVDDVELTHKIYHKMRDGFPVSELRLIDQTVRMFTEPKIEIDRRVLLDDYVREVRTKRAFLKQAGTTRTELMSNDKFANALMLRNVDPPRKTSLKTGKEAWAFAKSDEEFKQLLDHPNEQVRWLVEARLSVKSTIKETRSKRFYKIGSRGAFPVYLRYYGAHTGRWSGGDKQNAQNMNRLDSRDPTSGALRRSWVAPKGWVFVVCDLEQIEARMLAYWAGQEDLVQAFRNRIDPYCHMATGLFNTPVTKEDKKERQVGKATVLGCFSADTNVLTNRGWVAIVDVHPSDMVWDGVEWVPHKGVVYQGEKECLTAHGITATPDHGILTEHSWVEWQSVLTNPSLFRSAISKGSLPSLSGAIEDKARAPHGTRGLSAVVDGLGSLAGVTTKRVKLPGAISALRKRLGLQLRSIVGMPPLCRTTTTGSDYSTVYLRAYNGATTQTINNSLTMGAEEYMCPRIGGKTERSSSPTSSLLMGGILRIWNSTAQTITKAMSRAISGLYHVKKTQAIKEQSGKCRTLLPTYDIALAGPRNRFTVATDAGPIIVHNCGYQMGWMKFQESLRVGFLGMDSLVFDESYAEQLGMDIKAVLRSDVWVDGHTMEMYKQALTGLPLGMDKRTHLVHCAVTKEVIDRYRAANPKIVDLWGECQKVPHKMSRGEHAELGRPGLIRTTNTGLRMPNGLEIQYHRLQRKTNDNWSYLANERRKEWKFIYGGKMVENCIAEGTHVLTPTGWVPIEAIQTEDKVHDGVEFVTHGGVVCKQEQTCVAVDGVWMTPDHEVLTDEGWKTASSHPRPYRPSVRCFDGAVSGALQREETKLDVPMSMWEADDKDRRGCGEGSETGGHTKLRMPLSIPNLKSQHQTRDEQTPGVRSLAQYVRQVPASIASSMAQLWSAWDTGLRELVQQFRELLGGYGAGIQDGAYVGANEQHPWVQPPELQMGNTKRERDEQKKYRTPSRCPDVESANRDKPVHSILSTSTRLDSCGPNYGTRPTQQTVYDILNSGPRRRFVVRGQAGPFIVHNCTQGLARIVLAEQLLSLSGDLRIVSTTHDEIIALSPVNEAPSALARMQEVMSTSPPWAIDLPLSATGGFHECYGYCEK